MVAFDGGGGRQRWWAMAPQRGYGGAGAAAVVHRWGAGGVASLLEGHRWRLPMRRALAVALAAARQQDYGGGTVGVVGGGSPSLGWRWQVSYVGGLAAAPWEQLDNQLYCDGSKAVSTTMVTV